MSNAQGDGSGIVPVQIAVRIRPLGCHEALNQSKPTVQELSPTKIGVGKSKKFTFHNVFGPDSRQQDVFAKCVEPIVQHVFDGYNCTIMAYGQTGSGKTFTMGPSPRDSMGTADTSRWSFDNDSAGMLDRAVHSIFCMIREQEPIYECTVSVSAVEIYLENVSDLFDPSRVGLQIRETQRGETVLLGATSTDAPTEADVSNLLLAAATARRVASTTQNQRSSRSHAIYSITLKKVARRTLDPISSVADATFDACEDVPSSNPTATAPTTYSVLQFVDLAGSERSHHSGPQQSSRFKEAVHINGGLLALGNVVSALAEKCKKKKNSSGGKQERHIPYRDSKLTRLLKNSLGGNSRTVMILCVCPTVDALPETLNTLTYGTRARAVENAPVINTDPHTQEVERMRKEIAQLQNELTAQRAVASVPLERSATAAVLEISRCIAPVVPSLRSHLGTHAANRLAELLRRHGAATDMDATQEHTDNSSTATLCASTLGAPLDASWAKTTALFAAPIGEMHDNEATRASPAVSSMPTVADSWAKTTSAFAAPPQRHAGSESASMPAGLVEEVQTLRRQVHESKQFLQEDEAIFAAKVAEIESLSRENTALRTQLARQGRSGVMDSLEAPSSDLQSSSHHARLPWQRPFSLGWRQDERSTAAVVPSGPNAGQMDTSGRCALARSGSGLVSSAPAHNVAASLVALARGPVFSSGSVAAGTSHDMLLDSLECSTSLLPPTSAYRTRAYSPTTSGSNRVHGDSLVNDVAAEEQQAGPVGHRGNVESSPAEEEDLVQFALSPTERGDPRSVSQSFADDVAVEVACRIERNAIEAEHGKINELSARRWDLGVLRDSLHLDKLRRSQRALEADAAPRPAHSTSGGRPHPTSGGPGAERLHALIYADGELQALDDDIAATDDAVAYRTAALQNRQAATPPGPRPAPSTTDGGRGLPLAPNADESTSAAAERRVRACVERAVVAAAGTMAGTQQRAVVELLLTSVTREINVRVLNDALSQRVEQYAATQAEMAENIRGLETAALTASQLHATTIAALRGECQLLRNEHPNNHSQPHPPPSSLPTAGVDADHIAAPRVREFTESAENALDARQASGPRIAHTMVRTTGVHTRSDRELEEKYETKMQQLSAKHTQIVDKLSAACQSDAEQQRTQHQKQMAELRTGHERAIRLIREEHTRALDTVKQEHEAKVQDMSKSLYYYKKRTRELRRMLEACTDSGGVVITNPFDQKFADNSASVSPSPPAPSESRPGYEQGQTRPIGNGTTSTVPVAKSSHGNHASTTAPSDTRRLWQKCEPRHPVPNSGQPAQQDDVRGAIHGALESKAQRRMRRGTYTVT
eukprot:m.566309 g.566309  ORF g.566309 m.566309 type:complete len:1339 (-) comp22250_c0_seq1:109-4125(-)